VEQPFDFEGVGAGIIGAAVAHALAQTERVHGNRSVHP